MIYIEKMPGSKKVSASYSSQGAVSGEISAMMSVLIVTSSPESSFPTMEE